MLATALSCQCSRTELRSMYTVNPTCCVHRLLMFAAGDRSTVFKLCIHWPTSSVRRLHVHQQQVNISMSLITPRHIAVPPCGSGGVPVYNRPTPFPGRMASFVTYYYVCVHVYVGSLLLYFGFLCFN